MPCCAFKRSAQVDPNKRFHATGFHPALLAPIASILERCDGRENERLVGNMVASSTSIKPKYYSEE
jgi:hypothetical protein